MLSDSEKDLLDHLGALSPPGMSYLQTAADLDSPRGLVKLLKKAKRYHAMPRGPFAGRGLIHVFMMLVSQGFGDILGAYDTLAENFDQLALDYAGLHGERARLREELTRVTADRDAARAQLQTIGRKAFWASKASATKG